MKNQNNTILKLKELANSGDAEAQYKLGEAYSSGDLVEKNFETSIEWYQKAASNGNRASQVILGRVDG